MPEFILPEEADHCPHCNAVLRDPPDCCPAMEQEHWEEMHRRYPASDPLPRVYGPDDDERPYCEEDE